MIKLPNPEVEQLQFTGERYVPGTDPDSEALHYHRYIAAAALASGKDVLDIASGEGYGSWIIAQHAKSVTGVERAPEAVAFARTRYARDNLVFKEGECANIPLAPASIDLAVCFETIEHITEQEKLLQELRRVLRPDGLLLISSPDKANYNQAQENPNPFHERELSRGEFAELLSRHFPHVAMYEQSLKLASVIWPSHAAATGDNRVQVDFAPQPWWTTKGNEVVAHDGLPDAVIQIAAASARPVDSFNIGGFFQCLPYSYPISALRGGVEDRIREAEELVRKDAEIGFAKNLEDHGYAIEELVAESRADTRKRIQIPDVTNYEREIERDHVGTPLWNKLLRTGTAFFRSAIKRTGKVSTPSSVPLAPGPMTESDKKILKFGRSAALGEVSDKPDVSVIIPVFNQCEYTLACLRSLAVHETSFTFEVIVVDDHSSDETQEKLSALRWLTYIRQTSNQGFIASCNKGLASAKGKYVVFLNNDTEVLPGWLDELVWTFKNFPKAGLVGSRLLFPTGYLQESGGILWRDGSAWNYGRDREPRDPQFCYARQVDYCSGASIMLPRDLMLSLGGFDTHFAPAYCEDSDLAMRIRQHGRTVMVQPLSNVIHYEGITSGKDTSSGVKSYQIDNSRKLFERWKATLSSRPENAHAPTDAKDFGLQKRLLVIDAITPEPDRDAGSVTCLEIMRSAQLLGYQVTFIPYSNFCDIPGYTAALQRIGIEALYHPYCRSVKQHLLEYGSRYDAIMVYRVGILSEIIDEIRSLAPRARLVYHTSDLHHLREEREAEIKGSKELAQRAQATKKSELSLIQKSDVTIVHSLYEKEYLNELVPGAQVEVFNWILDPIGTSAPFEDRSGLMFLGGFSHQPNVDGVNWFLDEVWPLVSERLPGLEFFVIGSKMPEQLRARQSDRVKMVGYVENLQPVMDSCRLSVAPLRFGAGTKGKIAMSLAHGLPVVTTPIGAEGMKLVDGVSAEIAESPQDFAEKIIRVHENPVLWSNLSQEGIEYVRRNLSRSAGTEIIGRALSARGQ